MSKLTEYGQVSRFDTNDILIKDGTAGTKKILAKDAAVEFAGLVSSINHRNVWRGKYLGPSVTTPQKTAIQNGSFDDLYIGDYWESGGVKWRIADMDYWLKCGDTSFEKHHLVIVPDTCLISGAEAKMNDSDTTANGYMGSKMYKETMVTVKNKVNTAFPSLVLSHKEILTNATKDGYASGHAWVESTVELMNEIMVYGCHIYAATPTGATTPTMYTTAESQLAMFRLNRAMINIRANYWLRDIVNASAFAFVDGHGSAGCHGASATYYGVRPVFAIGS